MNERDLKTLWPHKYRLLGPGDPALAQLPTGWKAVAASNQDERLASFKSFIAPIFRRMPKTLAAIDRAATDAYLVEVKGRGHAMIVDFVDQGVTVSYFGFAPRAHNSLSGEVGKLYDSLDGFSDLMSTGGLKPLSEMVPMGREDFTFETPPSSDAYDKLKTGPYLLVFDNGASGYGYLKTDTVEHEEPGAVVLWTDDEPPMFAKPFWDLFDSWTAIALGQG